LLKQGLGAKSAVKDIQGQAFHGDHRMLESLSNSAFVGLDDTLDQISKEVETVMASGITISSTVLPINYLGMQFDDELSDKPIGIKRLRFSITYASMNNAPDVLT